MGKTIKLPKLLEVLEAQGLATEELKRTLARLRERFPQGDVPISVLEALVREFFGPARMEQIIQSVRDDLMQLFQTGKSKVKDDDSAFA